MKEISNIGESANPLRNVEKSQLLQITKNTLDSFFTAQNLLKKIGPLNHAIRPWPSESWKNCVTFSMNKISKKTTFSKKMHENPLKKNFEEKVLKKLFFEKSY